MWSRERRRGVYMTRSDDDIERPERFCMSGPFDQSFITRQLYFKTCDDTCDDSAGEFFPIGMLYAYISAPDLGIV